MHIACQHLYVVRFVEPGIMLCVVHTPFINVVCHHTGRTCFGCGNGKDAGAAAAVEHTFAMEVHVQQTGNHHLGGLMGTSSKSHLGVNHYFSLSFPDAYWMFRVVDDAEIVNDYRLKPFFFPNGVPVAVFSLLQVVTDMNAGNGKLGKLAIEQLTV